MKRTMINEFGPFYEAPLMCGACKCSINGRRGAGGKTWCVLFEKSKITTTAHRSDVRKCLKRHFPSVVMS